jgi:glycosyltransferase involved in cell wall biosynthesis
MQTNVKISIYVPHGAVPDRRSFAPAIVAWNHALRMKSCSPTVISAQEDYPAKYEIVDGVPVYRINEGRIYRRLFRKITHLDPYPLHRRAAKILRHDPPALIHAHQIEFPVRDFRRVLGRNIPVVIHAHARREVKQLRDMADRYIAVSEYTKSELVEKGYPADRIEVVYNGVDTMLFSPLAGDERAVLRKTHGIPADSVVVSFIGRKQQAKGFESFLKVVKQLLHRHDNVYVLAVGPSQYEKDPARDSITQLLSELGNNPRYLDFPSVSHEKLPDLYRMTDILLFPTHGEQHPLVVIEAMSSGCLVIASEIGGIRETLRQNNSGILLADARNLEEIMNAAESAVNRILDPATVRMRQSARQDAVSRFGWDAVMLQLEKIYFDVIGRTT